MNAQEVDIRQACEHFKEAAGQATQALRDVALSYAGLPGNRNPGILGAIEAATHKLAEARKAYLAALCLEA